MLERFCSRQVDVWRRKLRPVPARIASGTFSKWTTTIWTRGLPCQLAWMPTDRGRGSWRGRGEIEVVSQTLRESSIGGFTVLGQARWATWNPRAGSELDCTASAGPPRSNATAVKGFVPDMGYPTIAFENETTQLPTNAGPFYFTRPPPPSY